MPYALDETPGPGQLPGSNKRQLDESQFTLKCRDVIEGTPNGPIQNTLIRQRISYSKEIQLLFQTLIRLHTILN